MHRLKSCVKTLPKTPLSTNILKQINKIQKSIPSYEKCNLFVWMLRIVAFYYLLICGLYFIIGCPIEIKGNVVKEFLACPITQIPDPVHVIIQNMIALEKFQPAKAVVERLCIDVFKYFDTIKSQPGYIHLTSIAPLNWNQIVGHDKSEYDFDLRIAMQPIRRFVQVSLEIMYKSETIRLIVEFIVFMRQTFVDGLWILSGELPKERLDFYISLQGSFEDLFVYLKQKYQ